MCVKGGIFDYGSMVAFAHDVYLGHGAGQNPRHVVAYIVSADARRRQGECTSRRVTVPLGHAGTGLPELRQRGGVGVVTAFSQMEPFAHSDVELIRAAAQS
jgi:hypothetical protein